jgi:hypothetical protein
MRRFFRLFLLITAFAAGCQMQNWVAINDCLEQGGQWAGSGSKLPGGVCLGAKAK